MSYRYEVTQWQPGLYRIFSPEGVRMDLLTGDEKALLFDTGYALGDLKKVVRSITDKPLILVNSHGHLDHTCGNFQFPEPAFLHPLDMELCKNHTGEKWRQTALDIISQYGITLPEGFSAEQYLRSGVGNLHPVTEGTVFDLGGKTLEIIELPGHTQGSIGMLYREQKILYVGDAVNSFLWLFMPEATNLSTYLNTLEKVNAIDFTVMVQGHEAEPVNKDRMPLYLKTARNLDWEKGIPFRCPFDPSIEARICMAPGCTEVDFSNPGFSSIVISREHL